VGGLSPSRIFGTADITQDCQQPWLNGAAAKRLEVPIGAQVAFLRGVLRICRIAKKIARKRVDGVEMRQGGISKLLRLATIACVHASRHSFAATARLTAGAGPRSQPPPRSSLSCVDARSKNTRRPPVS